eukprot:3804891-Lingulodinium_polyedra.AAC.1
MGKVELWRCGGAKGCGYRFNRGAAASCQCCQGTVRKFYKGFLPQDAPTPAPAKAAAGQWAHGAPAAGAAKAKGVEEPVAAAGADEVSARIDELNKNINLLVKCPDDGAKQLVRKWIGERKELYKARTASKPVPAQFKTLQEAIARKKAVIGKQAADKEELQKQIKGLQDRILEIDAAAIEIQQDTEELEQECSALLSREQDTGAPPGPATAAGGPTGWDLRIVAALFEFMGENKDSSN